MVLLISVRTELAAFRLPYSDKMPVLNKTNVQISELPIDQVDDVESAPDCYSDVEFAQGILIFDMNHNVESWLLSYNYIGYKTTISLYLLQLFLMSGQELREMKTFVDEIAAALLNSSMICMTCTEASPCWHCRIYTANLHRYCTHAVGYLFELLKVPKDHQLE